MVFLFRVIPGLVASNATIVLYINIGVFLDTLILIYFMWYWSITDALKDFFSAVNLATNVEVCTTVCSFDDHVAGIGHTTENNPVIIYLNTLDRKSVFR